MDQLVARGFTTLSAVVENPQNFEATSYTFTVSISLNQTQLAANSLCKIVFPPEVQYS